MDFLPRFLALGSHLEKIHMTWVHLEKKQTRLWTYTKYLEESYSQSVDTASEEMRILSVLFEITPNLAMRATGTPLNSLKGAMWYLFNSTSSGWCKMDAHSTDFGLRIQTNILRSISTWEDLTTHFLAQFFPLGRTVKLRNDILMFQQYQGESISEAWTHFKDAPEKVLIREEAKNPVTKNVNYISLTKGEEENNDENDVTTINDIKKTNGSDMEMPVKKVGKDNEAENGTKNELIKRVEREIVEAPNSQHVGYYLKHMINQKLIEGLVDNQRFTDSLSRVRVGKIKGKTYNLLPKRPVYEATFRKR
uniref:Zinc finger, CCHC-type n=1 Tax=Tanacetum cinerariifolium TaxID=118510 RepID=A0A6L2KD51_TANCI|nr:zinc finger, CCHC-type [Tanacetum cinerariifolium]